ncbi:MAG: biopolymer transporter ExbD [Campylobacteraceae bacterium 4484_166]|nr:MAG: biopolymer transporter ExbD [Campylobacteraceae bacterium 4484_166]
MYSFEQKPDLNITPLVDVMLVLLAIMMVTAPVIEYEESINLPKGSRSKTITQSKKIDIQMLKDNEVLINKDKIKLQNFADSFVLFAKGKSRDTPVHIRADKNLKYSSVMEVLRGIKEVGFLKVSLITNE